ncbi:MAG: hypothetical protein QNM02_15865, partial [Acidimicrobiia bacterium]|nr:hypothetical protein [Acidimicrobiia bacterium]
ALAAHSGAAVTLELLSGDDGPGESGPDSGGERSGADSADPEAGAPASGEAADPASPASASNPGPLDAEAALHAAIPRPLPDEEDIDLDDLVEVPPESVKTPIDRLAEAFPGSELIDESA